MSYSGVKVCLGRLTWLYDIRFLKFREMNLRTVYKIMCDRNVIRMQKNDMYKWYVDHTKLSSFFQSDNL